MLCHVLPSLVFAEKLFSGIWFMRWTPEHKNRVETLHSALSVSTRWWHIVRITCGSSARRAPQISTICLRSRTSNWIANCVWAGIAANSAPKDGAKYFAEICDQQVRMAY